MSLTEQLEVAKKYHAHLAGKNHADTETFAAIVATLEKMVILEQVSDEMAGRKTRPVEIAP